ncbi:metallophosphoesterase [Ruminococcus sp.]|uniref:metallophosphoesterase family protein n=1 Tax=Ruminococcus sp. TaxID=41978 RepID=UPI0025E2B939|nr:metallophosphoesterase [Ruminococcus sp.]MBR1433096.1 metallophosphoesterase [Ruminococcus sp.]
MKIVVVADSHGNYANFSSVLKLHRDCDYIIHAGDGESDMQDLEMYDKAMFKKLIFVGGNCDVNGIYERTKVAEVGGVRIFIAHGDRFEVKTDKSIIARKAIEENCQAAIFGHSHIRYCDTVNGVFLLNPGSCDIQGDKTAPSYAIMTVENGVISAEIFELE